jgi:hypothetical protein
MCVAGLQIVDKPPQGLPILEGFVLDGVHAQEVFSPSSCVGASNEKTQRACVFLFNSVKYI